uniref:Uncharacterized protein n=1 Tax=Anguilla anguilla TaxID=7936 RepID=A0A0E9R4V2_ANGAN
MIIVVFTVLHIVKPGLLLVVLFLIRASQCPVRQNC